MGVGNIRKNVFSIVFYCFQCTCVFSFRFSLGPIARRLANLTYEILMNGNRFTSLNKSKPWVLNMFAESNKYIFLNGHYKLTENEELTTHGIGKS